MYQHYFNIATSLQTCLYQLTDNHVQIQYHITTNYTAYFVVTWVCICRIICFYVYVVDGSTQDKICRPMSSFRPKASKSGFMVLRIITEVSPDFEWSKFFIQQNTRQLSLFLTFPDMKMNTVQLVVSQLAALCSWLCWQK